MTKPIKFGLLPVIVSVAILAGCGGGGGGSSSSTSGSGGGTGSGGSGGGSNPVNNTAPLVVDAGPPAQVNAGTVADNNVAFTTITVCVPGTNSCQTLDHVEVDTGSEGLRFASDALTKISLPTQTTFECLGFADGTFIWGPLATADIQIAGEVAKSVPVQIASTSPPPTGVGDSTNHCNTPSQIATTVNFGSTAILGLGLFRQDCGGGCAQNAANDMYFSCSTSACNQTAVSLQSQLQNPVWMFPQDNNGIILQLPPISANGVASVNAGNLIFGIGTQSDNGIGTATAIIPDPSTGNFSANFKGTVYNDVNAKTTGGTGGAAFIDSGSNGLFFLDSATLTNTFGISMPDCPTGAPPNGDAAGFYCPGGLTTITGGSGGLIVSSDSSQGIPIGSGRPITLNIANGLSLINSTNTAFNDLAGPNPFTFDLGLPFFFGQSVFFGIEGQSTPLGTGPLYAF